MIQSLLIANRGEIACRVIDTAREMGIRTIAVYSDADAKARHVRMADEAVHIGPPPARESYLVGEKIIAAATERRAEAIHPGYGFLSENADFAQAVIDAGLIWVGPSPHSIRAMGLKDAAKERMIAAGVPVTPGYLGEDQDPDRLKAEADAIGYPVLIKAVAGGGGKGMRRVDAAQQFSEMLQSCKREAAASFGDDRVLIEKYILSPRHIEVQVFGDARGNVVHLFERDCSLQRRHQKVIEEAPAPGMDADTREAVCAAAVRAAKAVDYVGAGTIEFIADASEGLRADRVWFMEMNTRLQVEHPVTEEITGVDLVEWQLRVASGEPLPMAQDELEIRGHAIEARLYAEDPASGFLPSTGRLDALALFEGPGTVFRIETGVEQGDAVSPHYDPMIAKLIVHGWDRGDVIDDLKHMLTSSAVWPVKTNAGFLYECLDDAEFAQGAVSTGFIAAKGDALIPAPIATDALWSAAALRIAATARWRPHGGGGDPWERLAGFRLNAPLRREIAITQGGETRTIEIPLAESEAYIAGAEVAGGPTLLVDRGQTYAFALARADGGAAGGVGDGAILAPMPGKVIAVDIGEGDIVTAGQKLLTLEAMKMEYALTAPFDGTVAELTVETGAQVSEGTLLVRIDREG